MGADFWEIGTQYQTVSIHNQREIQINYKLMQSPSAIDLVPRMSTTSGGGRAGITGDL